MPFPVTWRGTFTVPAPAAASVTAREVLGGIARALDEARASDVAVTAVRITYRVALFRPQAARSSVLGAFDQGVITVRSVSDGFNVEYEVSLRRLFWASALIVPISLAVWVAKGPGVPLSAGLPVFTFGWPVMFGGSALIALIRYPAFLRQLVRWEIRAVDATHACLAQQQSA